MISSPAYYQRRARRRLIRLVTYTVGGVLAGGLLAGVIGVYLMLFF